MLCHSFLEDRPHLQAKTKDECDYCWTRSVFHLVDDVLREANHGEERYHWRYWVEDGLDECLDPGDYSDQIRKEAEC